MTPTSTHSVTPPTTAGNTAILSTLAQVAEICAEAQLHDAHRALTEALPLLRAELGQLRYYRGVMAIPSKKLGDGEKLVLMDLSGEVRYRHSRGQDGPLPLYIEGRCANVGKSSKTYGRAIRKLGAYGALERTEERANGRSHVLIEPGASFFTPWEIEPPEERNHGGARKPRCIRCGSERFRPVAWECAGCGITYDELPYLDEEDPDGGVATTPGPEADPPTDNLSGMVNPQWGGVPGDNLSAGSGAPADGDAAGTHEGGGVEASAAIEPDGRVAARVDGEAVAAPDGGAGGPVGEVEPDPAGDPGPVAMPDAPPDNLSAGCPEELKALPRWVAWRPETTADGRPVKPPYRPSDRERRADVMDPATWGTYEEALKASGGGGGVGFVLTEGDPYALVDLDGCRNPETGELEASAAAVVGLLDSYTEVSPSGKGLHVWVKARIPGERRRSGELEMYDRARYVTVTGRVVGGRTEIRDRQAELEELYRRTFGGPERPASRPRGPEPGRAVELGDAEIIARVCADPKGRRLWGGDTSGYDGDPSRADLALLNCLARHTRDPGQLDRLFRLSGLYRPKWERADYRGRTIALALGGA